MKKFTHYGVEVMHQYIELEFQFEDTLTEKGIEYTYLPINPNNDIRNNVVKYFIDGDAKYALLINDHCIITTAVPEDGNWYNLYIDIRDQINGEDPQKIKSKARIIIEEAEKWAKEELIDKKDITSFLKNPTVHDIGNKCVALGYDPERLLKMPHEDIANEYLEELIKETYRR